MRRSYLVLIGVIAVICVLVLYVLIAKPVVVLPAVTVPLSEGDSIGAVQRQMKINELNLVLRTNGKLAVNADGQQLASLSYTPVSLSNTSNLVQPFVLTDNIKTVLRTVPFLFPALASNASLTGLTLYYVLPVEITVRFVSG